MGAPSESQTTSRTALSAGMTLGRYELLAPIATGGMAHVWAARLLGHGGFSKLLALKMIRSSYAQDVEFQQMFLDEARIASRVRHPNVCETFDLGEQDGVLYLAMEWVDGPSLLRMLRVEAPDPSREGHAFFRRTLPPRVAARIVADACAGLHAAHELVDHDGTPLRVVHRDVSPHNILVTSSGEVKVTDFGVAKAVGKTHATRVGHVKGKLSYMSPEQLRNLPSLDRRSDVFALGAVLFEATTARRPFAGESEAEIAMAIVNGARTAARELDPDYPPELEAIVARALELDPSRRFQSAAEMRDALESYLARAGAVDPQETLHFVEERCGAELARRREDIRAASAMPSSPPGGRRSSEPDRSGPRAALGVLESGARATIRDDDPRGAPHDVFAGATEVAPPPSHAPTSPGAPRRSLVAFAALGAALGTAIAGTCAWWVIGRANVAPSANTTPATATAASPGASESETTVSAGAWTTSAEQRSPSDRVTFRISPSNAVLVVDGVVLPSHVHVVQRPGGGRTMQVRVRADRYEDVTESVGPESPPVIVVSLVPLASLSSLPPSPSHGRHVGAKRPVAAPTASAALPNPYE